MEVVKGEISCFKDIFKERFGVDEGYWSLTLLEEPVSHTSLLLRRNPSKHRIRDQRHLIEKPLDGRGNTF